jgi:multidrug transporter EmrE-like cation transporter
MIEAERSVSETDKSHGTTRKQLLIRFCFCYIALYYLPDMLVSFPLVGTAIGLSRRLWQRLAYGMAGVDSPSVFTGSGDTFGNYMAQLAILILALVCAVGWQIVDRRSHHSAPLLGWLRVLARYALALALLSYACVKLIPTQFTNLVDSQLTETYGNSSPMRLLWNFMGYSTAYTIFSGCAELLPAILLLFRRTALLGSLIAFGVMLNIVMMNFCYDVPVKLYSLNLLLLAVFLMLPERHRLYGIFVSSAPIGPSTVDLPIWLSERSRTISRVLKLAALTIFIGLHVSGSVKTYNQVRRRPIPYKYPLTTRGFHWIQEAPYNR